MSDNSIALRFALGHLRVIRHLQRINTLLISTAPIFILMSGVLVKASLALATIVCLVLLGLFAFLVYGLNQQIANLQQLLLIAFSRGEENNNSEVD